MQTDPTMTYLREQRIKTAFAKLEAANIKPGTPDFSGCTVEAEARWVALGGNLEMYRKLTSANEIESLGAMQALEVTLGAKKPVTT